MGALCAHTFGDRAWTGGTRHRGAGGHIVTAGRPFGGPGQSQADHSCVADF